MSGIRTRPGLGYFTLLVIYNNLVSDYERCCCNLFHVKIGTWIIGITQLIFVVVGIVHGAAGTWNTIVNDYPAEEKYIKDFLF